MWLHHPVHCATTHYSMNCHGIILTRNPDPKEIQIPKHTTMINMINNIQIPKKPPDEPGLPRGEDK